MNFYPLKKKKKNASEEKKAADFFDPTIFHKLLLQAATSHRVNALTPSIGVTIVKLTMLSQSDELLVLHAYHAKCSKERLRTIVHPTH